MSDLVCNVPKGVVQGSAHLAKVVDRRVGEGGCLLGRQQIVWLQTACERNTRRPVEMTEECAAQLQSCHSLLHNSFGHEACIMHYAYT